MANSLLPLLTAGLTLGAVGLIFVGAVTLIRRDPVRSRLNEFSTRPRALGDMDLEDMELELPFTDRIIRPLSRTISGFLVRRTPQETLARIKHDLVLAGSPGNITVTDFLGIKGMLALGLGGLTAILVGGLIDLLFAILLGIGAAIVGYVLPSYWLRSRIGSRRKAITRALPDVLDLLVITVEAGLGFDGAMQKVAEKWDNPLTQEFSRAMSEMRMGSSRRDALRAMVERTDAPDVASFIGAVVQADQLGVSVAHVLRIQADQMRIKRRQRAEEMAHKAQIKMLIPMVFLIFPSLYIVILGPAIPQIIKGLGSH